MADPNPFPGQSLPGRADETPIREETATKYWGGLTPSEKKSPEGTAAHRKAAAAAALETPTIQNSNITGDFSQRILESPEYLRHGGAMSPDEIEDQRDVVRDLQDHLDWAKERFPDGEGGALFGAERIESIAKGPKNSWTPEQKDQVHGWRDELGPSYELVEVTDGGDLIYEGPGGEQESVNQGTGQWVTLKEGEKAPTWRDQ